MDFNVNGHEDESTYNRRHLFYSVTLYIKRDIGLNGSQFARFFRDDLEVKQQKTACCWSIFLPCLKG